MDGQLPVIAQQVRYHERKLGRVQLSGLHGHRPEKNQKEKQGKSLNHFIASIVPFPIHFYRKDNLPIYEIEQIDKKEEEDNEEDEYKAFS